MNAAQVLLSPPSRFDPHTILQLIELFFPPVVYATVQNVSHTNASQANAIATFQVVALHRYSRFILITRMYSRAVSVN